jgi:hypothetical protein
MDQNFKTSNKTKKLVEENPLFTFLQDTVFFKTFIDQIGLEEDEISNVRIIKNRDTSPNILLMVLTTLFCLLSKSLFVDLTLVFKFLFIFGLFILLVLILFIKKFTYKLLINSGRSGFNEFPISKRNVPNATYFVNKFKNKDITEIKKLESQFKFKDFKEFR